MKYKTTSIMNKKNKEWWRLPFVNVSEAARRFSARTGKGINVFRLKAYQVNGNSFNDQEVIIVEEILQGFKDELSFRRESNELKAVILQRIKRLKKENGSHFNRTFRGKQLNEFDLEELDNATLMNLFELMIKIHYTQR